jgi:hypothetical protein
MYLRKQYACGIPFGSGSVVPRITSNCSTLRMLVHQ